MSHVTPLPDGARLPAVIEADDDGLHVVMVRPLGEGPNAPAAAFPMGRP